MGTRPRTLCWSVRHERVFVRAASEAQALTERCRRAFGPSYNVCCSALSGPVEGVLVRIARGSFHAEVSLQRHGQGALRELRMVGQARHDHALALRNTRVHRDTRWGVFTCAIGSSTLLFAMLELLGVAAAWNHAFLLVPVLALWRTGMMVQLATRVRQQALLEERLQLPAAPMLNAHVEDLQRWHQLCEMLDDIQHTITDRLQGSRPFRTSASEPPLSAML